MSDTARRGNYGRAVVRAVDRSSVKRNGERRFPHQVDVPVPGSEFGRQLAEMLEWCSGNVVAGMWSQHGHGKRRTGDMPSGFARFYFTSEADAAAFRRQWVR